MSNIDRYDDLYIRILLNKERHNLDQLNAPDNFDEVISHAAQTALSTERTDQENDYYEQITRGATAMANRQLGNDDSAKKASFERTRQHFRAWGKCAVALAALAAAALLLVVGISFSSGYGLPDSFMGVVRVQAAEQGYDGMDLSAGFVIKSEEPLTERLIKASLVIDPPVDYSITLKDGGKQAMVTPEQSLDSGQIYQISFDPENYLKDQPARASYTWAFQTETDFSCLSIAPVDELAPAVLDGAFVLTFSREVLSLEAERCIKVISDTDDSRCAGSWSSIDEQLVFSPDEELSNGAVYRVEISEDLTSSDGEQITGALDYRFKPATELMIDKRVMARDNLHNYTLGEELTAGFGWVDEQACPDNWQVKIYSFSSADAYANRASVMLQAKEQRQALTAVSTDGMSLIAESEQTVAERRFDLPLAEDLAAGFYLLTLQSGDVYTEMLFSVSFFNVYLGQGTVWVHDAAGNPVAGAKITSCGDGRSVVTSADGLAELNGNDSLFLIRHSLGEAVVDAKDTTSGHDFSTEYTHYLSLNQYFYQAGDKMQIFGVADALFGSVDKVKLVIVSEDYLRDPSYIHDLPVNDGVYSGTITLPALSAGKYYLHIYVGEDLIDCRDFAIVTNKSAEVSGQAGLRTEQTRAWYHLDLSEDEENELVVYRNQEEVSQGRFVFFNIDDEQAITVSEDNGYRFSAGSDGSTFAAVYFDGKSYHEVLPYTYYKEDDQPLRLTVSGFDEDYQLGDVVDLEITLTDAAGKPVSGYVNLHISGDKDKTGSASTQEFFSAVYDGSHSYDACKSNGYFTTVKTDVNGKAVLELPLGSNLASARLIWRAYLSGTNQAAAGLAKIDIEGISTLELDFDGQYLAGDEPVLSLRLPHDKEAEDHNVSYTVRIPQLSFSTRVNGSGDTWTRVKLDALPPGEYTLELTAECACGIEETTYSFRVKESFSSYDLVEYQKLDNISFVYYSGKAIVAHDDLAQLCGDLVSVAEGEAQTLSQLLDVRYSRDLLAELFELPEYALSAEEEKRMISYLTSLQLRDGGLASVAGESSSLELSVVAAIIYPDLFDSAQLKEYFRAALTNESVEDRALALWGLAILDQPVLADIEQMLSEDNLSVDSRVYLACALYSAGNGNGSLKVAKQLIGLYEQRDAAFAAEQGELLGYLALLAGIFDLDCAPDLINDFRSCCQNAEDEIILPLSLVLSYLPEYDGDTGEFTYIIDGNSAQAELSWGEVMVIPADEDAALRLSSDSGNLGVCFIGEHRGLPDDEAASHAVSLTKSYSQPDSGSSWRVGDMIRVTVNYEIAADAPAGKYHIYDTMPAGFNYRGLVPTDHPTLTLVRGEDAQTLKMTVSKDKGKALKGSYSYLVSAGQSGSYGVEPCFLISRANSNVIGYSQRTTLTIAP